MVTPDFAVLFPGDEVFFTCNIASGVLWLIDEVPVSSDRFPAGVRIFNSSTLAVNMSDNATTYACGILGDNSRVIPSNAATLVLAS